jgi:CheY-like chemotaxis protein
MSERKKTVVVIEDREAQREVISLTLAQYGFNPVCGETIARTLELLREHKDDTAVIILDMLLDEFSDYQEETAKEAAPMTGTGLARRLLMESTARRPEIIILTAFGGRVEYLKQAIEAGASEYLVKGPGEGRRMLVPYVQALALKNSFQPSSANEPEIARLSEGHANRFELLDYFCRNKLTPELDLCLAPASYVLLLRTGGVRALGADARGSFVAAYTDVAGVPGGEEFDYAGLHRSVFEHPSRASVYRPPADELPASAADTPKEFSFIQLLKATDVEVALGLVDPFPVEDALGEYPFSLETLVEALAKHASPTLETFVEKLVLRWQEKQAVKLERVRTLVGVSGAIQRRLSALAGAAAPGPDPRAAAHHEQLKLLSQELADYSHTLSALLEGAHGAAPMVEDETTRLSDVVQEIKSEYDRRGHFDAVSLSVEADCLVPAERYFFSLVLRELVRWSVERPPEASGGARWLIRVRCTFKSGWTEIHFRENSERMSRREREGYLFEPMSRLHVVETIVEVACHGKLIDATDELPDAEGHLFKIMLLQR